MRKKNKIIQMLQSKSKRIKRAFCIKKGSEHHNLHNLNYDDELNYYSAFCSTKGLYEFLGLFHQMNKSKSNQNKAIKLLKVGKNLSNSQKNKTIRFLLAQIAIELSQSTTVLKGYCWAAIHCGYYEHARFTLDQLYTRTDVVENDISKLEKSLVARSKKKNTSDTHIKNLTNETKQEKISINKNNILLNNCFESYKNGDDPALLSILLNYSRDTNLDQLLSFLNVFHTQFNISTTDIQSIYIKLGKIFSEENRKSWDVELVEAAVKLGKNTMVMRAAFWAYQRFGNIAKSKESLQWLDDYACEHKHHKLKDFVSKRKNSYLFLTPQHIYDMLNMARNSPKVDYKPIGKKVAYILHNSLPYASGGYATRGHGLAVALTQQGYTVEVINRPGFPLDTKSDITAKDIPEYDVIEDVTYRRVLSPRRDKLATYEYLLQASEALYDSFLKIKPEIVLAASNHLTAIPAMIAARKLGIPFYYEVRGFWEVTRISREPEFENTEWYKLLCNFEAVTAKEADHVFTLTTPMKEELIKRGIESEKITLLPNSCNPDNFVPRTRDLDLAKQLNIPRHIPVIGYIGTFVQYEGLDHLAEACGVLKQKNIEFRLLIVGNENTAGNDKGPITQSILDIAKKYDFDQWLIMPGRIPHEEVESYYSLIDIAPFPRKPQPVTEMVSPMKPLEAAAMKKAIIASSVKALVDMIEDGQTGLIFEKGNIQDFASKLEELLQSDELRFKLGANARQWVENERTWSKTSNILISMI